MAGSSAGSIFVDLLLRDAKFSQGLRNSSKSVKTFERDIVASLKGVGAAFAGLATAREILKISDQFINISSRLKIFEGDAAKAAATLDKLYAVSQRNFTPLADAANGYIRLSNSLNEYQKSQYDLMKISELLAQTLRLSGSSAESAAIFYQQFGQAASSDFKAIGQELQTFADQNPVLYGILKKEAEKAGMTIKDFAEQGMLSFDLFAKALFENADDIQSKVQDLDRTVTSSLNNLYNAFSMYIAQSPDVKAVSDLLIEIFDGLTSAIDESRENAISFSSAITGLVAAFKELQIAYYEFRKVKAILATDETAVVEYAMQIERLKKEIEGLGQKLYESTIPLDQRIQGPVDPRKKDVSPPVRTDADLQKELKRLYETNEFLINGNTKALQKYKDTQADLKKLLDNGKISLEQYNTASAQLTAEYDLKANRKSVQEATKAQNELNRLYDENEFLINGNTKELQDYINTQADLQELLESGKITVDQYYTAWAQLTKEYEDNASKVEIWGINIEEFGKQAASNIQDAFADFLFDPFDEGIKGMAKGFVDAVRRMIAEAQAAQLAKMLLGSTAGGTGGGFLGDLFGGLFSGGGSVTDARTTSGWMTAALPKFADGGYLAPGQFGIAGEAGAELLYGGKTGVSVFNQDQMGGGGNTYYVDTRGADNSAILRLERALVTLAGPGVIEERVMNAQMRGEL